MDVDPGRELFTTTIIRSGTQSDHMRFQYAVAPAGTPVDVSGSGRATEAIARAACAAGPYGTTTVTAGVGAEVPQRFLEVTVIV